MIIWTMIFDITDCLSHEHINNENLINNLKIFIKNILLFKKEYYVSKRIIINFLMGTHERVGKNSSIYGFTHSKMFETNVLPIIFSFAGLFPYIPHSFNCIELPKHDMYYINYFKRYKLLIKYNILFKIISYLTIYDRYRSLIIVNKYFYDKVLKALLSCNFGTFNEAKEYFDRRKDKKFDFRDIGGI